MTAREHSSETFAHVKSVPQEPTCGTDYDPQNPNTLHTAVIGLRSLEHHLDRAAGLARFLASYAYMSTCSGGVDAVEGDARDRHANLVVLDMLAEHVTAATHLFHRDGYVATKGEDAAFFRNNYRRVTESPFDPAGKERTIRRG